MVNRLAKILYEHSPSRLREWMLLYYSKKREERKYGPFFYQYYTQIEATQFLPNEELEVFQNILFRRLIRYVWEYVPYYRGLLKEHGLTPEDFKDLKSIERLPYLTKDIVRKYGDRMVSDRYRLEELEHFQTSGTTGKAIDVYATLDYLQMEKAFQWLHRSWGGIKRGDRQATFIGYSVVPFKRGKPPFWIYDPTENRTFFSLHHMTKENLKYYVQHLNEIKPDYLVGYPMAIYILSSYILDGNPLNFKTRAIFTASETLMDYQRPVIEDAFGCRVYDWYGQTEFTANIVQCEEGNYHIKYEYGIVELLNERNEPASPGEWGEIVATGLNNLAMPFIRYRTGDLAIPKEGKCSCGRGGRLIEKITGRVEDIIVTPDGRMITRLDFLFKNTKNIVEAQLEQDSKDHIIVRIVPDVHFGEEDKARLNSNIREHLGDGIKIDFLLVDAIPRTKTGKFRYVISHVNPGLPGITQPGEREKGALE